MLDSPRTRTAARRWVATAIALALGVTSVHASADDESSESDSPREASSRPHCVGWAIVGGIGGTALGWGVGQWVASAIGDRSLESVRGVVSVGTGEALGATLLPIVTCKASADPRTVPAASFLIGGGLVGGAVTAIPTYFALAATMPDSDDASLPALAFVGAVGVGGVAGAYLGWRLHKSREPSPNTRAAWMALPSFSRNGAGVALQATF